LKQFSAIMAEASVSPEAIMSHAEQFRFLLCLSSALSLPLKSFAAPQYHILFPNLSTLYSLASELIKQATSGKGLGQSISALRLVRKQILVLTAVSLIFAYLTLNYLMLTLHTVSCHALGLASDVSCPSNGEAVNHFVQTLLPSLLTVAIEELQRRLPDLVEVQLFITIDQVLNHLGVRLARTTPSASR
jgi:hypothetical protein